MKLSPFLFTTLTPALAKQISDTGGFKFTRAFFFKMAMLQRPIMLMLTMTGFIVIFFGLMIQAFERGQVLVNAKSQLTGQFEAGENALWLVINSLVTVGYGDIIP